VRLAGDPRRSGTPVVTLTTKVPAWGNGLTFTCNWHLHVYINVKRKQSSYSDELFTRRQNHGAYREF
jgi:hypothetical protein